MTAVCAACGAPTYDERTSCASCGDAAMSPSPAKTSIVSGSAGPMGLPENVAALLAYATVVPAILLLSVKPYKNSTFIRFHALQSLAMAAATVALGLVFLLLASVAGINLLLIPISIIAAIGIFLVRLVCMIKAYQHDPYKLPLLGGWAEKQAIRH
jgi:uncharacterized membrane protein